MKRVSLLTAAGNAFPQLSRDEVYAAILCGEIFVDGEKCRDPRTKVADSAQISRESPRFVSRGGLKLDHALGEWRIDVTGMVMLDAGSSTGGFTDCLLQRGAAHVHAVEVGTNQLAYSLRTDPRVSVYEQTNIMSVTSMVPQPNAAVADLSFRSLTGAAAHILQLTRDGWAIVLVKPQFELRGSHPDFDGVIRNEDLIQDVLEELTNRLWTEGVFVSSVLRSPVLGRRGNREYLFLVRDSPTTGKDALPGIVRSVV